MRIIDFSQTDKRISNKININTDISSLTVKEKIHNMWYDIKKSFSTPITNTTEIAEYTSTQLLAEIIKHEEYDGLCFNSQFGGINYVFFQSMT
jgi:hypothetical protein